MVRVGEKIVVVRPFCTRFGLTGIVRMIDDDFIYIDYDEESVDKLKKSIKSSLNYLTGEAFSPRFIQSHVSYMRHQKLVKLGI